MLSGAKIKIGSFNLENLFLRYKFNRLEKGENQRFIRNQFEGDDAASLFESLGFKKDDFQLAATLTEYETWTGRRPRCLPG